VDSTPFYTILFGKYSNGNPGVLLIKKIKFRTWLHVATFHLKKVGVVLFVFLFAREVWCGMGWLVEGGERERGGAARALRDYIYLYLERNR
jgi:hypothetical protein